MILFIVTLAVTPSLSVAQGPDAGLQSDRRVFRKELFLGYHKWDELAELSPAAGGSFDANGFNLGGAFHWRTGEWGRSDVLAGLDFAFFSNDSDVRHIDDDLISRGLYLTPSIKLMFDNGTGPVYALDFGLGYYLVDIADVSFFDLPKDELWEDSAFGGYLGASVDFPSKKRNRLAGFSMSAKIHFFDLGKVEDEGSAAIARGTLGPDAGSLSGPVVMLQFGYYWF